MRNYKAMKLKFLADTLNLNLYSQQLDFQQEISSACIDSRQAQPGTLFVALKGANTDGHKFAKYAEDKGAIAVLCSEKINNISIPQFIVPDVTKALGQIARAHRALFSIPIIALTGSNGKTSVKEMIHNILPEPAFATRGNLNNQLGVPLSLLRLDKTHTSAVFELGASHVGEIAYLADLVMPDVAIINNIAPAHIGEFGSIEAIANTKGEIFNSLKPNGFAILNADDPYANFWDAKLKTHSTLRFSSKTSADIYATDLSLAECSSDFIIHTPLEKQKIHLAVPGVHNISNALAATAACYAINIPLARIAEKLEGFSGVKGRLSFLQGQNGAIIIDDSYNANLRSVTAAINVLAKQQGTKILVLGDMGELGIHAKAHHQEIGKIAKNLNIDLLYTCGQYTKLTSNAFGKGAVHLNTQVELVELIKPKLNPKTTVLIKGSRSAMMENIVNALT